LKWPTARPALATLIDEFSMPLPDAAMDRVLLGHALEMSDDPERLLRRGVARAGAVRPPDRGDSEPPRGLDPHRQHAVRSTAGLIRARRSRNCCGRHGSRRQHGARRCSCRRFGKGWFLRSAMAWERVGAALSLPFAGVAYRGSDQAGLSRDPRRAHAADSVATAGAGAVVDGDARMKKGRARLRDAHPL